MGKPKNVSRTGKSGEPAGWKACPTLFGTESQVLNFEIQAYCFKFRAGKGKLTLGETQASATQGQARIIFTYFAGDSPAGKITCI